VTVIADAVVAVARRLPRGGFRLVATMSRIFPELRRYPLALPVAPSIKVRADLSSSVYFPLLKYGLYPHQAAEDLVVMSFLREGDCVVDVGANIGYFSLLCATCVGDGVVHAIEPSRVAIRHVENLAASVPQIRPWQLAMSRVQGLVRFVDEDRSDRSHIATNGDSVGYDVPCRTIDDWMAGAAPRVDFLKIDAEGHDLDVVRGAAACLHKHQPVVEFEAFDLETVDAVSQLIRTAAPAANYAVYRCFNRYPTSVFAKTPDTHNWFAIPEQSASRFPSFLFRRGFLVAATAAFESLQSTSAVKPLACP
jgi:FkbM family methyltransferase